MINRRLAKVGSGTTAYYDITGGHGIQDFATGGEATIQKIRGTLNLILGEWFLDITQGIPWIRNPNASERTILGSFPADPMYAETVIKAAILRVEGVHAITQFTLDFNHTTRAASCSILGVLESGAPFTVSEAVL
jgi:hypothetical protein